MPRVSIESTPANRSVSFPNGTRLDLVSLSRSPDYPVLLQRPRQKHGEDYSR
jgi:hypothetical protein